MAADHPHDEGPESVSLESLHKQLAHLMQRVEWLEKALEEKRVRAPATLAGADFKRRMATMEARWKAIDDFARRDETAEQAARRQAYEEERNAYLRSRGFENLDEI